MVAIQRCDSPFGKINIVCIERVTNGGELYKEGILWYVARKGRMCKKKNYRVGPPFLGVAIDPTKHIISGIWSSIR